MTLFRFLFCLTILMFVNCNDSKPKDVDKVREFVEQWNDNHTQLKSAYLTSYYMDVVTYYGKERTKLQVQNDKNLLFEQFPDYEQRILKDQFVVTKEAGSYLVTFTKQVTYNGIEANYTSYLSIGYKNHKFKILREGVSEDHIDLDVPIFPYGRENNPAITKNRRLYGDFDGDGLSDYATVMSPDIKSTAITYSENGTQIVQCVEECNSVISFSNKKLKDITVEDAYESQLENLKDLNSDNADELGFWNIKPTTKSLYVFDPTNGTLLINPIVINTEIHKNLSFIDVFKKTGPNKITVTHSEEVQGKWILKSEVITLD